VQNQYGEVREGGGGRAQHALLKVLPSIEQVAPLIVDHQVPPHSSSKKCFPQKVNMTGRRHVSLGEHNLDFFGSVQ
jgi:hypothetical protein